VPPRLYVRGERESGGEEERQERTSKRKEKMGKGVRVGKW